MLVPLAGGGQETLLSEVGAQYLLPLFSTAEACALRLVCREFLAAVSEQPWEDRETPIHGSIAAWRTCFPRARIANVGRNSCYKDVFRSAPVVDADLAHLAGLRELNLMNCRDVTDADLVHLRGINSLELAGCSGLTDAALVHLAGIQRLGVGSCTALTDGAFVHLRGSIQHLNLFACTQLTDAAFSHLHGIKALFMNRCSQPAITDAALVHLRGIRTLAMDQCNQATLTGATFASLTGIEALCLTRCSEGAVAAARALELPVPPAGLASLGGLPHAFFPWRAPRAAPW